MAQQGKLLIVLWFAIAEKEQDRAEAGIKQHAPSAGNDFAGIRSVSLPGQWFVPHSAKEKSQQIEAVAGVLRKK
jgi:hypothetical protein